MKKIFLLVIVLSTCLQAQYLPKYLMRSQAIEPIFTAAEVHAFFNDAGTYDTTTNLYSGYVAVVKNLSLAQQKKLGVTTPLPLDTLIFYECYYDSVQKMIIPDNLTQIAVVAPGYFSPTFYPKYDLNGQCTIKLRVKHAYPYTKYTWQQIMKP